ncbi:S1C family serine protease [Halorubrum vacuolatum]|uniref:Serine protease, S1-C subfamily, contains C-terminal PDZ domain n=1 Tax=Halorubrum vacuolatum TaxID=63740 RepID=A0A238VDK9_HALVU|nr:trypsin-like peptidase domain-containing protein [Halorubrum vacuolatum]SNR32485.1 serine protease, S1-C subfamily, contains C-terminal PDZ domain [Halorubrum vacuolatum]
MERTRRGFLGLGGAAITALAGCLAPTGDGGRLGVDAANEPPEPTDPARVEVDSAIDYGEVYEAVSPSVARIQIYVEEGAGGFFGGDEGGEAGQGSGFRYTDDMLVTNDHVLAEPDAIRVQTAEGTWLDAEVVGRDPFSDLAVIQTDGSLPGGPLPVAESIPPVGTDVLVVGSPLGLSGSATQGIISGTNRTIPGEVTEAGQFSIADAIQTDAALNPGNSGGPIVTLDGNVVGVATATQGENIGFGVSAALLNRVVPELIETGEFEHSHMGVSIVEVDPLLAEANDLPEMRGVYIVDVDGTGPSADLLRGDDEEVVVEGAPVPTGGDTIAALDGEEIATTDDLSRYLALETDPGDDLAVTVWRDGEEETVDVELGVRPEA